MEFRTETPLPVAAERALDWHRRPGAFQRLVPPWMDVRVESSDGGVGPGQRVRLRVRKGPLSFAWTLEHAAADGGAGFTDFQVSGPFAAWRHDHLFTPDGLACRLTDRIRFALPLPLAFAHGLVRRDLERLFRYRHRVTREDLVAHARAGEAPPRTVLVSGASGFVGSAVRAVLAGAGHRVLRLVRRAATAEDEVSWDPRRGLAVPGVLGGVDAVVHLAGESIAGGYWTRERMRRIRGSRALGTRVLAEAVAAASPRPSVFLSASAIGIYGSRGDDPLDEDAAPGSGFLAEVGRAWEDAVAPAEAAGVRTVRMRLGLVLDPGGGLLAKLLPPFRLGLGGPLGDGSHWMSWVTRDDVAFAFLHALHHASVTGAVNVCAPAPVRNVELTRVLARVLGRPAVFRVPAAALRLVSREMAREVFLASQRVVPRRLPEAGFEFRDPDLEPALRHLLGRMPDAARADPRAEP